jgi:cell division protein FtsW (lipid II flippase)
VTELHALAYVIFLAAVYVAWSRNDESGSIWPLARVVVLFVMFMVLVVLWPK